MKKRSKYVLLYTCAVLAIILSTISIFLIAKPYLYTLSEYFPLFSPNSNVDRTFTPFKITLPRTVTLSVSPGPSTPFFAQAEFVPIGFVMDYAGGATQRPDLGTNVWHFFIASPSSIQNLQYTIRPDPTLLCPGSSSHTFDSLYLAPTDRVSRSTGPQNIITESGKVYRDLQTHSTPDTIIPIGIRAYFGCENGGYTIQEVLPPQVNLVDPGNGVYNSGTRTITWSGTCPSGQRCPNFADSYEVLVPSNDLILTWSGTYSIFNQGSSMSPVPIIGNNIVNNNANNCIDGTSPACAGEICGFDQVWRNGQCVNACGTTGYQCASSCTAGQIRYPQGDAFCQNTAPTVCCHTQPTCTSLGGVCMDVAGCPVGYTENTNGTTQCSGGIPQEGRFQPVSCCVLNQGGGGGGGGSGTGRPPGSGGPPGGPIE